MRYRLRTLVLALAFAPPLLAAGWAQYAAWQAELDRRQSLELTQVPLPPPTALTSHENPPSEPAVPNPDAIRQ